MTPEQAIDMLRKYNHWRRAQSNIQPHPTLISEAIDTASDHLDKLLALAKNLLDPEMYGYAVTSEVRDAARVALGRKPTETRKK